MATSVRQLARDLNVSPATVSRVLNDRPGVSPELRQRILDAIRADGYPTAPQPGRSTPFVGIIVPELENPAFASLAFAIETQLARYGITAMIGSSTLVGYAEENYVETLLRHGVHGLVLASGSHANPEADHSLYRELSRRRVAMVLINGSVSGLPIPSISTDERLGAVLAVRHLADLGHKVIGLAGGEGFYRPSVHRLAGFRAEIARLRLDGHVAETQYTMDGGREAAEALLAEGVTGIVAGSDVMALGALRVAHESGLVVPRDLSVIGYDDTILCTISTPSLTSVRQPFDWISAAVARAMSAQLSGGRPVARDMKAEPLLVARASTGPRRR